MKHLLLVVAMIFATGCATKNYTLMETPEGTVNSEDFTSSIVEYRIQPQDRLMITSYNHTDLIPTELNKNGILVDTSGYISLPLVHRVHVAGLSQAQAGKKLEKLYSKYLKGPSFNVEAINKRVYVLGEVKKPGAINLDKEKTTLLEAIAQSGDLTDNAVRDNIIILRRDSVGHMKMRKVDLTHFDAMQASNMMLYPNDIVYVQPNTWKKYKVTADNISSITRVVSGLAAPYLIFK